MKSEHGVTTVQAVTQHSVALSSRREFRPSQNSDAPAQKFRLLAICHSDAGMLSRKLQDTPSGQRREAEHGNAVTSRDADIYRGALSQQRGCMSQSARRRSHFSVIVWQTLAEDDLPMTSGLGAGSIPNSIEGGKRDTLGGVRLPPAVKLHHPNSMMEWGQGTEGTYK